MFLTNAQLVLPGLVTPGSVRIDKGRIASLVTGKSRPGSGPKVDINRGFLAPGFIDLHVHGARGRDTMEANTGAFETITRFHLAGGTTSITLTTQTAPEEDILRVLEAVAPHYNRSLGGARIVGVHIEGPFISPQKAGAQNPRFIRPPQAAEWKRYLRYGRLISQMTLAPELPGSLPLIRALRRNGSIASGGHTNATEGELLRALKAGLNHSTHTYNCMSTATKVGPLRVPGMLEFALAREEIICELIADGQHVVPLLMKILFRAKGPDGACLITDAIAAAGLPAGTIFSLAGPGSPAARATRKAAFLRDGSALAGSLLTMMESVKRAVTLGGASLADAVRMATLNPARQLKRAAELGTLQPGARADLVWFDRNFKIHGVWLDGVRQV